MRPTPDRTHRAVFAAIVVLVFGALGAAMDSPEPMVAFLRMAASGALVASPFVALLLWHGRKQDRLPRD